MLSVNRQPTECWRQWAAGLAADWFGACAPVKRAFQMRWAIMNFNEEHAIETYKSMISISVEGMKALQLINGGAVVALLAYLGQVSNRAQLAGQIGCPVFLFVLGLTAGTFAFFTCT